MEREEMFSEVRRRLEIRQDVREEVVRVGIASVRPLVGLDGRSVTMAAVARFKMALAVVEDDHFVDAEDREGSGDLAG